HGLIGSAPRHAGIRGSPDSPARLAIEAETMKISELMHRDVVSVSPETTLKEVAALLVANRISGVPVCLSDGRVVGVVSEADIIVKEQTEPAHRDRARFEAETAGAAMTTPALTVSPQQDVVEAARLMTSKQVNRLPVVKGSRLVGIITRADLVR